MGDVRWSVVAGSIGEAPWLADTPSEVLPTASVGKLLLLGVVAEQLDASSLAPEQIVSRVGVERVGDSGLWHLLDQDTLTVVDACRLVGAVSDNLATNVLVDLVGVDAVAAYADRLGLAPMALLDRVRSARTADVPPTLSVASAESLARFMTLLHAGSISARVADWISSNVDLSMVASAFDLDPLAHRAADEPPVLLINKTGTDSGIRADVGLVTSGGTTVAYAAIARWDPDDDAQLAGVLARMREIGRQLADRLADPRTFAG